MVEKIAMASVGVYKIYLLRTVIVGVCTNPLSCQRGGYADPNNCGQCRCPDGFAGTTCNTLAPQSRGNSAPVLSHFTTSSSNSYNIIQLESVRRGGATSVRRTGAVIVRAQSAHARPVRSVV